MFKDLTTDQKRQVIALAMEQGITDVDQIAQIYDAQEAQQKEKSNPYTQLYEEDLNSALAQSYNPAVTDNPYEEAYASQYGNEDTVADEDVNMYAKGGSKKSNPGRRYSSLGDMIIASEGFTDRFKPDGKDKYGNQLWAIGNGFNISSKNPYIVNLWRTQGLNARMSKAQARQLLDTQFLPQAEASLKKMFGSTWNSLTSNQKNAFIDLHYQSPYRAQKAVQAWKKGDRDGVIQQMSFYPQRTPMRLGLLNGTIQVGNGQAVYDGSWDAYALSGSGNTPSYNSYSSSANSASNRASSSSDTGWDSLFGGSQNSTMGTISEKQFNDVIKNGYQALAAKNGDNGIDTTKQAEVDKTYQTAYDNLFKEVEEHNNSRVEGNSLLDAAALLFNSRARRSGREGVIEAYIPKKDVLYEDVINSGIQNYLELPRYFTYGGNLFYPGGTMDDDNPQIGVTAVTNRPVYRKNWINDSQYIGTDGQGIQTLFDVNNQENNEQITPIEGATVLATRNDVARARQNNPVKSMIRGNEEAVNRGINMENFGSSSTGFAQKFAVGMGLTGAGVVGAPYIGGALRTLAQVTAPSTYMGKFGIGAANAGLGTALYTSPYTFSQVGVAGALADAAVASSIVSDAAEKFGVNPSWENGAMLAMSLPFMPIKGGGGTSAASKLRYMIQPLMTGNKIEKRLNKLGQVKRQALESYIAQQNPENREIMQKVLRSEDFIGKEAIDYNRFKQAVSKELVPQYDNSEYVDTYATYGLENVLMGVPGTAKTLKHRSTRIPEGSVKHFDDSSNLGHTRIFRPEDPNRPVYILENQSDWVQNLLKERSDLSKMGPEVRALIDNDNIARRQLIETVARLNREHGTTRFAFPTVDTAASIEGYPRRAIKQYTPEEQAIINNRKKDWEAAAEVAERASKAYNRRYSQLINSKAYKRGNNLPLEERRVWERYRRAVDKTNWLEDRWRRYWRRVRAMSKYNDPVERYLFTAYKNSKNDRDKYYLNPFKIPLDSNLGIDAKLARLLDRKHKQEFNSTVALDDWDAARKEVGTIVSYKYKDDHQNVLDRFYKGADKKIKRWLGVDTKEYKDPDTGSTWIEFEIPQNFNELEHPYKYGGPLTDDNNPYDVFNQKERSPYLGNSSWGFVNLANNTGEFNSYVKDNVGNVIVGLSGEAHRDYPGAPFMGLLPTATVTAQRDHFDPIKGKFNYKPLTVEEEKSIEDNIKGRNNLIKSGRVDIVSPEFYLLAGTAGLGTKNIGNAAKGALNTVGKYSTPSTWTNALTRFKPTQGQLMELARSPYGIAGGGIYSSPLLGTPTNAAGLLADTAAYGLGIEELYKGAQAIDKAVGKPSLGNIGNAAAEAGLGLFGMIPAFGSNPTMKALDTLRKKADTTLPEELANLLGIVEKLPEGVQKRLTEAIMRESPGYDFYNNIPSTVRRLAKDPIKSSAWLLTGNNRLKPELGHYTGFSIDDWDQNADIIDAYLYNADLSIPGLVDRVKVNSLQDYGPHAKYIEKNYPHLVGKIPIYDIKQGNAPIEEVVYPVTEFISNEGTLSDYQIKDLEDLTGIPENAFSGVRNPVTRGFGYWITPQESRSAYEYGTQRAASHGFRYDKERNVFPYYYNPINIAGHLVQFGVGANSRLPYIRHQDIWKFLGPDYLKRWYRNIGKREVGSALGKLLDFVNNIGTPIVTRGGWSHKYGGNLNRNSYAKGGSLIDPPGYLYQRPGYKEWLKTVPKDRIGSNYDLQLAYNLEDPEQLERWRTATIEQQLNDPSYHLHSVYMDPRTGYGYFAKLGDSYSNPEYKDEKNWYFSPEAKDFRQSYQLVEDGKRSYYRPRFAPYLLNKR